MSLTDNSCYRFTDRSESYTQATKLMEDLDALATKAATTKAATTDVQATMNFPEPPSFGVADASGVWAPTASANDMLAHGLPVERTENINADIQCHGPSRVVKLS